MTKKWGIFIKRESESLIFTGLKIPRDYNPEMEDLYNTRNRAERIKFAKKKRSEDYTVNDIALLLHSPKTIIEKYLAIPENEMPVVEENLCERQHIQQMANKKLTIMEVRDLYAKGHAIDEIMRLTGHTVAAIKNYLKDDCPLSNGHYDRRMPSKLAPYEQEVISMSSKGITYKKIHEHICQKEYTGTVAFLRMFMQKERTYQCSLAADETEPVEYIPRNFFANLYIESWKK